MMTVSTEIDQSAFEKRGYSVIPDLLTADEAAEAWSTFDSFSVPNGGRSANERQVLKHDIFGRILMKNRLLDAVEAVLGDDLQLLAMDSLETAPQRGPRGEGSRSAWHVDFTSVVPSTIAVNVAMYLQDMTPETGPLRVIPGSHRWGRLPTDDEETAERDDEVEVPVSAGTGVMFDAQIWHTGSANHSERPRRGIFTYFGHYWMKRMDEFARSPLPSFVTESTDSRLRQLFGLGLQTTSPHGSDYNPDNPRWW
jgi:ectoine hydroxylase-related dioxygenase (phytanoyl-CoA dioxygenase family)